MITAEDADADVDGARQLLVEDDDDMNYGLCCHCVHNIIIIV